MSGARVTLENITLSYRRHPAVHHVSGAFEPGSLTAITGPNGAGKSTLLRAIAGLERPQEGRIRIEPSQKGRIAYLPQAASLQRDFPVTVLQLASGGLWHRTGSFGAITPAMRAQAQEAIAQVGLSGMENRDIGSLSAGQFQRALFARLLLQDAALILLDEPFSAIDESTTRHLLDMLKQWHMQGRTVICVLHELEQIRQHIPRCLLLARECIAWDTSVKALHPENLLAARFFRPEWQGHDRCEQAV
ncbi:MAG: ABC transporter ATP-binding protein [Proteobacteria bacterium]|nr:ABC transporter ATP-binding protein [Pseudomonadota bacterium]